MDIQMPWQVQMPSDLPADPGTIEKVAKWLEGQALNHREWAPVLRGLANDLRDGRCD